MMMMMIYFHRFTHSAKHKLLRNFILNHDSNIKVLFDVTPCRLVKKLLQRCEGDKFKTKRALLVMMMMMITLGNFNTVNAATGSSYGQVIPLVRTIPHRFIVPLYCLVYRDLFLCATYLYPGNDS
jgi:hypothetical protein